MQRLLDVRLSVSCEGCARDAHDRPTPQSSRTPDCDRCCDDLLSGRGLRASNGSLARRCARARCLRADSKRGELRTPALKNGNGTIRTPHPCELFGPDWLEWSEGLKSQRPPREPNGS